jgi:hypothetical protein
VAGITELPCLLDQTLGLPQALDVHVAA